MKRKKIVNGVMRNISLFFKKIESKKIERKKLGSELKFSKGELFYIKIVCFRK